MAEAIATGAFVVFLAAIIGMAIYSVRLQGRATKRAIPRSLEMQEQSITMIERSLEMQEKSVAQIEESLALQRQANALLSEINAKLGHTPPTP